MEPVLQVHGTEGVRLPPGPLHLAIGMFDGVHLGHRAVVGSAVAAARQESGVAAVLTFWPHPSALFRPHDPTRLIQDPQIKAQMLATLGVDVVITEQFTPVLAQVPAGAFLAWLRERLPTLVALYVGENFRFGAGRKGDVGVLRETGAAQGIRVMSAPRLSVHEETVSSTRIRAHLLAGEIAAANALLGYSYFSPGVVTPGKQLGRTIGVPTLNLPWAPDLRPKFGVYAVRVRAAVGDSAALPGVANYGLRPTVEHATEPRLEVHVLGSCPFDAGDAIVVTWEDFVRPESRFSGIDALRAQIEQDRATAAAMLAARR